MSELYSVWGKKEKTKKKVHERRENFRVENIVTIPPTVYVCLPWSPPTFCASSSLYRSLSGTVICSG